MFTSSPLPSLSGHTSKPTPRSPLNRTSNDTQTDTVRNMNGIKSSSFASPIGRENFLAVSPRSPGTLSRSYSLSDSGVKPLFRRLTVGSNSFSSDNRQNLTSTHLDSQSPGYTARIVRYKEEHDKKHKKLPPTHQSKYNSVGVFPIVHFFKKDLPVLKQKQSQGVTVRIGTSPDLARHNTPEHNRMLLERIIRASPMSAGATMQVDEEVEMSLLQSSQQQQVADSSTRSVLDALKEISRKRIRVSEEYEINDDGKRMRLDSNSQIDSRKRPRDDSQIEGVLSPNSQLLKRYRSMDELIASQSSMETGEKMEIPLKKKAPEITMVKAKKAKRSSMVNVETQTIQPKVTTVNKDAKSHTVETQTTQNETRISTPVTKTTDPALSKTKTKRSPPLPQIFDERPLEIMRRNRLSVLMGAFGGGGKQQQKDDAQKLDDTPAGDAVDHQSVNATDKPLVSILSAGNKTPSKGKHVTFSIPSNNNDNNTAAAATTGEEQSKIVSATVTQTSAAIVTPIISSTVKDGTSAVQKTSLVVPPTPSSSPVTSEPPSGIPSATTQSTGSFTLSSSAPQFNLASNNSSSTQVTSAQLSFTPVVVTSSTKSTFGVLPTSLTSNTIAGTTQNNGLGFTLSSTTTTTVADTLSSSPVKFSFGNASVPSTTSANAFQSPTKNSIADVSGSPQKIGGFKFNLGSTASPSKASTEPTATAVDNKSAPQFSFGTLTTAPINKPFDLNGSAPASSSATTSKSAPGIFPLSGNSQPPASTGIGSFSFGAKPNSSSEAVPTTTSSALVSGFGANNNKSTSNTFGSLSVVTTTFPVQSTTSVSSTSATIFGGAITTNNGTPSFGVTASNSDADKMPAFKFGNSTALSTATTTASKSIFPSFGNANVSSVTNSGTSITAPSFGTTVTATPNFGTAAATSAPSFGTASSATNFGTTTSAPTFGTTTSGPSFGVTASAVVPTFGSNNTTPFGTTTTTTTTTASAVGIFGTAVTSSAPSFGTTTAQVPSFGTTTTASSMFGPNSKPTFGISTTGTGSPANSNRFGSTVASAAPSFGTPTTLPSFNSSFGGTPTTTSSGFGIPSTTSVTSIFQNGNNALPAPASNTAAVPAFGTATTTAPVIFGGQNASTTAFGKPLFGQTTSTTANSSTATNAFVGSSAGFGATNAFGGTGTTTANNNNSTFRTGAFGSTPTAGAASTTGFGGTTATNVNGGTAFSAIATTTAISGFGTGSTGFGSTSTPAFGAPSTTNSFGSTAGKISFGGSTNAFGSSTSAFEVPKTAPTFGGTTNATPATAAPSFASSFGGTPNNTSALAVPGSSTFGTSAAAPTFGSTAGPASSSAFGSTTNNNAFAAPSFGTKPAENTFGATANSSFQSNSFGAIQPVATTQSGIFTFGASAGATNKPAGIFSFGPNPSGEVPKPNFNFSGTPSGGGATTGAFGVTPGALNFSAGSSAPTFGVNVPIGAAAPQFGTQAGGMFSIGSGAAAPTGKRPQLKGRRRT